MAKRPQEPGSEPWPCQVLPNIAGQTALLCVSISGTTSGWRVISHAAVGRHLYAIHTTNTQYLVLHLIRLEGRLSADSLSRSKVGTSFILRLRRGEKGALASRYVARYLERCRRLKKKKDAYCKLRQALRAARALKSEGGSAVLRMTQQSSLKRVRPNPGPADALDASHRIARSVRCSSHSLYSICLPS